MTTDQPSERIWRRIEAGQITAVVGPLPSLPDQRRPLRARCDGPLSTLGPLVELSERIGDLLGDPPLAQLARERLVGGLRRRLLGEAPPPAADTLVEAANRLADGPGRPPLLILEAVEAADPNTLHSLRTIALRPGWLRAPLLIVFADQPPEGPAAELLATLRRLGGEQAVHDLRRPVQPPPALAWRELPADVTQILRAGALIGLSFEIDLVAALLELSRTAALTGLQIAADRGVVLEDRGDGRVALPVALAEQLRATTLPSLAAEWHRGLAALLTRDAAARPTPPAEPAAAAPGLHAAEVDPLEIEPFVEVFAQPAAAADRAPSAGAPESPVPAASREDEPPARHAAPLSPVPSASREDEPPARRPPSPAPSASPTPAPADRRSSGPRRPPSRPVSAASPVTTADRSPPAHPAAAGGALAADAADAADAHPTSRRRRRPQSDVARAADHLSAAGDEDAAAAGFVEAARQAAASGASGQALAHAARALAHLDALPPTPPRQRLRAEALLERGRMQWRSIGAEGPFRLDDALATADAAKQALPADAPAQLHAEISLLIAGIGHDRGDLRALERALAELEGATHRLLQAGDSLGAATLLNNQAEVYIRLGDPVRATHLLMQSRGIFEGRARDDRGARRELAETHHLLARLPLSARLRPGREGDAMTLGLDHALIAERTFRELGDQHELARVWETMARLELRKGRHERAGERLSAALGLQRELGDLVGLARTTAAFADLLASRGELREALGLLRSSVLLNREKGSPIGLAFNRRALAALTPLIDAEGRELAAALDRELSAAEALLGRHPLPPTITDA
ncbi:MAG: tetratricopeptide repeat protein [Nannocystis sp.]|nr:tetratricopeptide repeat protein [Nannocystis sp.]